MLLLSLWDKRSQAAKGFYGEAEGKIENDSSMVPPQLPSRRVGWSCAVVSERTKLRRTTVTKRIG